jgi:hypothetical protein
MLPDAVRVIGELHSDVADRTGPKRLQPVTHRAVLGTAMHGRGAKLVAMGVVIVRDDSCLEIDVVIAMP